MPFPSPSPRVGRLLLAALLALLGLAAGSPSSFASPSSVPGAGHVDGQYHFWEHLDGSEPAFRLFTPASSALFAQTASGLKRSDDAGVTWRPVELPPRAPFQRRIVVTVDPSGHTRLFANGEQGLYRTTDDATTWMPLALPDRTGSSIRDIAVSPADPSLVYVTKAPEESLGAMMWLLRSRDGGDTWEVAQEKPAGPSCGISADLFWPHPTDPSRVYRQAGCYRGEPFKARLEHSSDQGATWTFVTDAASGTVKRIVGGQGIAPERYYIATIGATGSTGPLTQVLQSDGGLGGWTVSMLEIDEIEIRALTYDPLRPDRVWAGLNVGTLEWTVDDEDWTLFGDYRLLGTVNDIALGVDGWHVYAATDEGIWRFPLPRPAE